MIDPFLCRVSAVGVPHTITHSRAREFTISGLSATDVCKLYWTLNSIKIQYSFSINGITVSRNILAETNIVPKNRIIAPVEFYQTGYDSATMTSYLCRLNFDTVYLVNDNDYGLRFIFNEIDITGAINFNTSLIENMSYVSCNFKFFNTSATAYLNYIPSVVSSAIINNFEVILNFFD